MLGCVCVCVFECRVRNSVRETHMVYKYKYMELIQRTLNVCVCEGRKHFGELRSHATPYTITQIYIAVPKRFCLLTETLSARGF